MKFLKRLRELREERRALETNNTLTNTTFEFPRIDEILNVLLLNAGYNSNLVLFGTTCLGIAAGVIGTFALLRKRALLGDALAHSTLPGLAMMFIVLSLLGFDNRNLPLLLFGAGVSGVLGVLAVFGIERYSRLKSDVAIGVVLSVFFGFGVVLLSVIQSLSVGGEAGINAFIYGQTASMRMSDAKLLAYSAATAVFFAWIFLKEFRLICFDREFAQVQGWPVPILDLILMTLIVGITVIGLQAVGLLLIVSLLITPAVSARFWTERVQRMTVISAFLGGLSGYFGAALSSLFPRFPAGALIVLTATFIFVISFLFAPVRGVIASSIRILRLRINVLSDHVLRFISETRETGGGEYIQISDLKLLGPLPEFFRWLFCQFLRFRGLLELKSGAVKLSKSGELRAGELVRRHRLWEEYVHAYGDLAVSHVDYSADLVEHVLSSDLVEKLEQALAKKIQLEKEIPSLHPLPSELEKADE